MVWLWQKERIEEHAICYKIWKKGVDEGWEQARRENQAAGLPPPTVLMGVRLGKKLKEREHRMRKAESNP